ncbi:hypothetical protein EMIHUDRAFT_440788 [Emiliania huxleyi CCMP1516]|uniref:WH2 domain-containing protein n=2 Tax=Emiliania huxleyi TaxID=2903 RepID=A0A0D3KJK1_EMIH1|nr:hypothetical protein EMIHUDRAFT_436949 [Emiliania huxleyi CCMP1516]XP_005788365.1 hypothetical protein EMIHUDRAFT_440788 [Emiliania huxleyi CCMP1516]EOD14045.1 hypothetical protein EMIHUDRAFT_436949 [Emiliania huxleyi CCMP1516]EOD35936.1 hypothetical protein EMIHUDRAFT_440788 [Emiliania huxleyi CCMP1516]|eukprot:XP_005766474.1 hypothetical protein EMIHUDRAFT_436949 [Emiliania huxleyi CCMP1516]
MAPPKGPAPAGMAPPKGPAPAGMAPPKGPAPAGMAPPKGPAPAGMAPPKGPPPSGVAPAPASANTAAAAGETAEAVAKRAFLARSDSSSGPPKGVPPPAGHPSAAAPGQGAPPSEFVRLALRRPGAAAVHEWRRAGHELRHGRDDPPERPEGQPGDEHPHRPPRLDAGAAGVVRGRNGALARPGGRMYMWSIPRENEEQR